MWILWPLEFILSAGSSSLVLGIDALAGDLVWSFISINIESSDDHLMVKHRLTVAAQALISSHLNQSKFVEVEVIWVNRETGYQWSLDKLLHHVVLCVDSSVLSNNVLLCST